MPVALPNTTVADNYPPSNGGAQIAGTDVFSNGWFTVANNPVVAEYFYGLFGQEKSSPEFFLAPGTYPLAGTIANPVSGIRFRNGVAGKAAQVWGAFFYKNDPILSSSAEFTSQVAAGGSVTPGTSSVQIQKNGVLIGTEPILDFVDSNPGRIWTITDDAPNTRALVQVPTKQIAYAEGPQVSITTFSNAALANQIVSVGAANYDAATDYWIEFYTPFIVAPTVSGARLRFWLFDGGGLRQAMALVLTPNGTANLEMPVYIKTKITPGAGAHTYSVRGDFDLVNSNWTVGAGDPFGIGFSQPLWMRVTRSD